MTGSPRLLVLRAAFPEHAAVPVALAAQSRACTLRYSFERHRAGAALATLLPEDFLVCSSDVIPGVVRHRASRQAQATQQGPPEETLAVAAATSTLLQPQLQPRMALSLSDLRIQLPPGFDDMLQSLVSGQSQLSADSAPALHPGRGWASFDGSLAVRLRAHNGRCFLGGGALSRELVRATAAGTSQQQTQQQQALPLALHAQLTVSCVPRDVLVACVLELLYLGPLAAEAMAEVVLAWAPVAPFQPTAAAAAGHGVRQQAHLQPAAGVHTVQLRSGPDRGPLSQAVLNWRGLLQQAGYASPATPVASFTLTDLPQDATAPAVAVGETALEPPPEPAELDVAALRPPGSRLQDPVQEPKGVEAESASQLQTPSDQWGKAPKGECASCACSALATCIRTSLQSCNVPVLCDTLISGWHSRQSAAHAGEAVDLSLKKPFLTGQAHNGLILAAASPPSDLLAPAKGPHVVSQQESSSRRQPSSSPEVASHLDKAQQQVS